MTTWGSLVSGRNRVSAVVWQCLTPPVDLASAIQGHTAFSLASENLPRARCQCDGRWPLPIGSVFDSPRVWHERRSHEEGSGGEALALVVRESVKQPGGAKASSRTGSLLVVFSRGWS